MTGLCPFFRPTFFSSAGWYLVGRRDIAESAQGRVTAPKNANISCLRVAFEAGYGWVYCGGHRAKQQRCPTERLGQPNPLNPLLKRTKSKGYKNINMNAEYSQKLSL